MSTGARTPEELECLLEDAFLTRDAGTLSEIFEDGAVMVAGEEARGAEQIGRLATTLWDADRIYLAEPRRVVQARRTALVVGADGIGVARRGGDGAWRFAIALLRLDGNPTKEER
jgi:hypothetical protein